MWPRTAREIWRACGVLDALPEALASTSIAGVTLGGAPARPDELFVALREDGYDGHVDVAAALAEGAALALVASDWDGRAALDAEARARCLVVEDPRSAFRALAAELRRGFPFPVIAVGGSQGKTTTKDLLAALLAGGGRAVTSTPETMNGWTGLPVTLAQRAHARSSPPAALVVEVGIDARSAMAEHARLVDPDVALLTSLGPEHLAGLGSVEDVVREELRLLEGTARLKTRVFQAHDARIAALVPSHARPGDVVVCRGDDPGAEAPPGVAVVGCALLASTATASEVELWWRPAGAAAPAWRRRFTLPMPGRHNAENLAVAAGAALALGRTPEDLAAGLSTFVPPAMRCQVHAMPNGCLLVDDAYNASPGSVAAALELLGSPAFGARPKVVFLGDMLDLGGATEAYHAELVAPLAALARGGARVCLFGDAMGAVERALAAGGVTATHLPSEADPCGLLDALDALDAPLAEAAVLVKGSRGMRLERVVAALAGRCDAVAATEDDLRPFHGRFETACVTGTNGKTTTTSLLAAIVAAAGEPSARVTTLGAWVETVQTGTTPTGSAFLRTLEVAARRGVRTLAVETTSHALQDGFTRGWPARVGVFTNLSRDHLDYHGSPERYLAAKAQLFMQLPEGGAAVLNVADPASALLDEVIPPGVRRLGYAARPPDPACAAIPLALAAQRITVDEHGTRATLAPSPLADALGGAVALSLIGDVHVENALAAALAASALGYDADAIRRGLGGFAGVPGRFEIVQRRPIVVVDYAHTPDALARTLSVARTLVLGRRGRVLCVFGCGGDRDPGKRGEMGAAAAAGADVVVLTSDNPRSEDPSAIAEQVAEGARGGAGTLLCLLDRREAIERAVALAREEDIVVVLGKGHEKVQIIGDRALPFDDVEVARGAAERQKG